MCAADVFSKYTWVAPLKDKRGISNVNAFQKIISKGGEAESKGRHKPNRIWVDQGGEFYNKPFSRFLRINNIKMYSTYNEGKCVVAERFTRTLKNKIFKHMKAISKNVYFDVLEDIVKKYSNTFHRTIKMKPIDVTSDSYVEYNEDSNDKDHKFKVGDRVRISKNKNIFVKGYTQNWSEVFIISKIKNTVPQTYVISDINGEPIAGGFYEKELQKTSQEKLIKRKIIKRKGDKLYVKWKGYKIHLIVGLIKKTLYKMSQYFPKPFRSFGGNINVEVDLSNLALKTNLASLKTEVDQLDIDKLVSVPVDLSQLSNVVKNDVVKKAACD